MTLGERIREARESAGLTQAALAKAVGVSLRTYGSWERDVNAPRNRLGAVERVLGVRLRDGSGDGPALRDATDAQLMTEIAARLARTASASTRQSVSGPSHSVTRTKDGARGANGASRSSKRGKLAAARDEAAADESDSTRARADRGSAGR